MKKVKAKPSIVLPQAHSYAKNILNRFGWGRYPPKNLAKNAAKIGRNQYKCAKCAGIFGTKQVQVDHIEPRIDPEKGWQGFDVWISRTFVQMDKLQVLCLDCHSAKSTEENAVRRESK